MIRSRMFQTIGLGVVFALAAPNAHAAGECITYDGAFFTSPAGCIVDPPDIYDKAYAFQEFDFNGTPQLAMDLGDDVKFYSLSNPSSPTSGGQTHFQMPSVGDAEHLMYQFSVDDDADYVFTVHRTGVAIAHLGTGSVPAPGASLRLLLDSSSEIDYTDANLGGLLFAHGNQTYVLTHVFVDACNDASLYRLGTNGSNVTRTLVECVAFPSDAAAVGVQGGRRVGNYLFVALNSSTVKENVSIYEIQDPGPTLTLRKSKAFVGKVDRRNGFAVDKANGLIASVDPGLRVVKVLAAGFQSQGSWANPVSKATISVPANGSVNPSIRGPRNVAIAWPLLWIDGGGLYDITQPSSPTVIVSAVDYFHPEAGGPQNTVQNSICLDRNDVAAVFHPNGTGLYLPRFPVAQAFDLSACTGPVQPIAAATITPTPAFPGQSITIRDTSAGTVESRAIWVTQDSNPDGPLIAGSPTLVTATTANQTLSWTIPVDLSVDNIYYAHVKVANADFPYTTNTPQQLKSVAISVDRAPDATINITPAAPITGSTISIQTTAEGSPGDVQGADPFELWVTAPGGEATSAGTWGVGGAAPSVQLTESGSWTLEVRVQYRHGASGGGDPDQDGLYETYESLTLDISSVAANFTIRESPAYQNADIHLDNSSSSADGAVLSYQWQVRSAFSDTAPVVYTCTTTNCVIPADTLIPGNHRFRLTLTNSATDPADVSTKYIDKTVVDGNINPTIDPPSSTPAVGESVLFHIDGINDPSGINQVVWNFGGTSCDSTPQVWTCTPGFSNCLDAAYKYATTGTKSVTATITFGGTVLSPPASTSFSVGPGTCGGTTSCSYSITPTSATYDALTHSGGFQVTASPSTCTWTATEGLSWVSITSGASGTGNGAVSFNVAQNSTGANRSGSISAAGRTFQITQTTDGLCDATLDPNPANGLILSGEPNASVAIQLSIQSGCDWTAKSFAGWLHVTPSAGVGNGTVTLRADENTWSDNRVGEFEIAGVTYELTQYPNLPADFEVSNIGPDRGEYVTFTVDPRMEVASWNFGDGDSMGTGQDCHGYGPVISCATVGQTACHAMRWNWPDQGPKYVTMTLANGDSQTHGVWVQNAGECPCETDPPATSFEMSANPVLAGEEVTFTDTTPDGTLNLKVQSTLIATPPNPIIGQNVAFILNEENADRVEWNYGATGCGGTPATETTTGTWAYAGGQHTYASGGVFTVRATAYTGSTQIGSATLQLTVQNTGSCDGGGGGGGGGGGTTCTYSISPLYNTFDSDGGSGQINITTQTDCDWNATESMSWVTLTSSASGTGNGTVTYSVATNPGGERSGAITVAGKTHTVTQAAEPPPPAGGPPETWSWRVLEDGVVRETAEGRTFTWKTPRHEAFYDIELTTSNCGGSTTVTHTLEVLPPDIPPVTKMLVPAAVRAEGLNNTLWKTDLNVFNPCDRTLHMRLTFLEDNQNNVNVVSPFILPSLSPLGSLIYTDVIDVFPFLEGQNVKGSIQIEWDDLDDCRPVVTSRTYNDTPTGTFGQSIPTFNITPALDDHIFFTGLSNSAATRTNLGFANFGDTDVGIMVNLLDDSGQPIGDPVYWVVPALSTSQIVRVADYAHISGDLDAFSARVDTGGEAVMGYASVIDNTTGDSWSYVQGSTDLFNVVVPGLAHVEGLNDSQWRSDIAFFNSTEDPVNCSLIYYPEDQSVAPSGLDLGQMQPGAVHNFHDFVGALLGADAQSKGYLRAECLNGASFPIVAARTYNEAPDGGTFGQNMIAFGEGNLIETGSSAWIPGIVNSSDPDTGFRSNLGIVNVSDTDWLGVHMTLYGNDGEILGEVRDWLILPPGGFYQKNPFAVLGDVEGSLKVEVYSGSAMIYLSKIDNMTGDPTTVLAIPADTLQ